LWAAVVIGGLGGLASTGAQASSAAEPDWLTTVNYWRQAAGVPPVTDQPAWDTGIEHHLTYLEDTPASYRTGQYASMHTENPASPYYTSDGAVEGGDSDLVEGVGNDIQAIDTWLISPFHAIGMLRAQLTQVAFYEDSAGYAGLDVIHGLDSSQPTATSPILYPGPRSTTTLPMASDYESPDPLQTCGWQGMQVGLPLIALLTQAPAAGLTASLSGPTGAESTSGGSLCVVDQNTYQTTDPVYGPTGLSILQADHAVLLIPRAPLASGTYSVDITQPGQPDIRWSFAADPPVPANQQAPGISGSMVVGQQLSAYNGWWTNDATSYADQWMRCDASGANCVPIAGATGSTYTLTDADAGSTIRLQVIASNTGGASAPAVSDPTPAIWAPPTYPTGGFPSGGGSSPAGGGSSTPTSGSSGSGGSPTTTISSKPSSCPLCVSVARPVAFLTPGTASAHHAFVLRFAGQRSFSVTLVLTTPSGRRLWQVSRHLRAGPASVLVALPKADTGRGKLVLIAAHFTVGSRHITVRGVVRFH
jgi:hypothetical protein